MEKNGFKSSPRGGKPQQISGLVNNAYVSLKVAYCLRRLQRMYQPHGFIAVCEDWDWLVIMQVLQDHHLLPQTPQRPPIADLMRLLEANQLLDLPDVLTRPNADLLSRTNRLILSARYPWTEVTAQQVQNTLPRWRFLYELLDTLLTETNL